MTVQEMLGKLTHQELVEWIAFSFIEPWGTAQEDYRFGVLTAKLHNMNTTGAPVAPSDIFPPYTEQERRDKLRAKISGIFNSMSHVG